MSLAELPLPAYDGRRPITYCMWCYIAALLHAGDGSIPGNDGQRQRCSMLVNKLNIGLTNATGAATRLLTTGLLWPPRRFLSQHERHFTRCCLATAIVMVRVRDFSTFTSNCFAVNISTMALAQSFYDYFVPGAVWSFVMSVCLSVRSHNSKTTRPNFTKFLCMFSASVARSSSYGVATPYVLPVL